VKTIGATSRVTIYFFRQPGLKSDPGWLLKAALVAGS